MEYFVYLTNDCNLNCAYCSVLTDEVKERFPKNPNYSIPELGEFIDRTQKRNSDLAVTVYLFGGEPCLEFSAAVDLVSGLQTRLTRYSLNFVLHTNGLLLHKIPDKLLSSLASIICSINFERIPHIHLANSYFSQIMDNITVTRKKKNLVILGRFTITEKTSLYTEILQFSHFFDYIYWQIENKEIFNDYKRFYANYTYELKLTFEYWIEYIRKGIILKYVPFLAILKFMFQPDRKDTEFACGYGSSMVYIQTDGTCFSCSDIDHDSCHYIGEIRNGVKMPKPSLLNFRCAKCNFRFLCMGRCGRMHKEFSQKQISRYCALNIYMFKLFIDNSKTLERILKTYPIIEKELGRTELELTEFTP